MNTRFCFPGRMLPYLLYFSLFYLLLWCWKPVRAQALSSFKPPSIGERVPDVTIENLLNYSEPGAKLSDFRGKLLILDFWATWCQPCVGMIPRMDSLEKQFAGKVVLLPVTYQTKAEVVTFRDKYFKRTGLRIQQPEVVLDTELKKLFPHSAVPHYVWIGADGTLRAITGREEVTSEKIRSLLSDQSTLLALKKDAVSLGYKSYRKPLFDFIDENQAIDFKSKYHMLFRGYIPGVPGQISLVEPGDTLDHWRITFTNVTPRDFYMFAYGQGRRFLSESTVQIQTRDSLKFNPGLTGAAVRAWVKENTFCYELVVPSKQAQHAFDFFQQDLDRIYPQYEAVIEKRLMPVYALVRTSSDEKFKSNTTGQIFQSAYDGFSFHLRYSSMASFVQGLNTLRMNHAKHPFVDQTGYAGMIDLDMELDFSDVSSVRKALAGYDLDLVEEQSPVEVLIIKDRAQKTAASIR
ncbi:redoxin domain-containing protein [Dyadobacter psychrotolerans]|uniref:Redoxin domain-containing protein n=1 Tax=Dyadobacter psychrotolerans TaxID=2541721 RepID=A0A4V2Z4U4_9BACT|nr:redoxin domain-containing protein [Dyadobacter psychrotolerans]TDE18058.1 redoxin domain-containing protein [Dyadobacter psychrotolerans]